MTLSPFFGKIYSAALALGTIFLLAMLLFLRPLVELMVPGFSPEAKAQLTNLLFLQLPVVLFVMVSIVVFGNLRLLGRLSLAESSNGVIALVYVLYLLLFRHHITAVGLGLSTVAAYGVSLFPYMATAARGGIPLRLRRFSCKDPEIREIFLAMLPFLLSDCAKQVNSVVDRIVASLLDSGSVTIDKTEVYDRPQAKENIFFVSDETVQFSRLTVNDLKSFYQSSYPTFDDKVFDDLISKLDLPRKKPLSQFSKGMKRQAIVAAALACRTKYILLDEAFDGLDPAMRKLIRTMIVDDIFDRGATLVVSSHNITEIGELCDKAMLLHKGEVIFAKDIDDVREGFEKVQIALPEGELDRSAIENAGVEVLSFKKLGRISTVMAKGEKADITAKLSALSPAVLELVPLTLEEIFIYEMEVRGYAVSEK